MFKYSKTTNSFFPEDRLDDYTDLPKDLVSVSEEVFNQFLRHKPGYVRGADEDGYPVWVPYTPPPLTTEQLEIKSRGIRDAFLNATDPMLIVDYTINDKCLTDNMKQDLIRVRKLFKEWPKSTGFPDLATLPAIPKWIGDEAQKLGFTYKPE